MNYKNIKKEVNINEYLINIDELCLVIYSQTSLRKNNINLVNKNFDLYSTKKITNSKKRIDELFFDLNKYKKIITIGGGTATDIGKYLSYKFKIELICIPTMLSTNAYATNKVALRVNNKIESLDAVLPDLVLLDEKILKNSKINNLYGMADIFSIYTALNDWVLASKYNNEIITFEFEWAQQLLISALEYVEQTDLELILNDIMMIYNLVGEAGEITNKYGSGKPESGSEHIFAKTLEKQIKIPHAIAVANGILLMGIAQSIFIEKKFDMRIYNALKKIGIYELNQKYNISYELIENTFKKLHPRKDRFSIINLIYKNKEKKEFILKKYKEILEKN